MREENLVYPVRHHKHHRLQSSKDTARQNLPEKARFAKWEMLEHSGMDDVFGNCFEFEVGRSLTQIWTSDMQSEIRFSGEICEHSKGR